MVIIKAYQVTNQDINTHVNISLEVKQLEDIVPRFPEHYIKIQIPENIVHNTVLLHSTVHPVKVELVMLRH